MTALAIRVLVQSSHSPGTPATPRTLGLTSWQSFPHVRNTKISLLTSAPHSSYSVPFAPSAIYPQVPHRALPQTEFEASYTLFPLQWHTQSSAVLKTTRIVPSLISQVIQNQEVQLSGPHTVDSSGDAAKPRRAGPLRAAPARLEQMGEQSGSPKASKNVVTIRRNWACLYMI